MLSDLLEEKAAASKLRLSEDARRTYAQGIETVRATNIEQSARQVGDAAIDAQLSGWDGRSVKLSHLWQEGPIVLMWYRGDWCPYCNIQLRAMQQSIDKIENAGAKLVVLTPELPEKPKETAQANDLDIVALHDKGNALARKYGLVFQLPKAIIPAYRDKLKLPEYNGNDAMELPLSATYVIDRSGTITYGFLDADYKKRAEPADVIDAVKAAAETVVQQITDSDGVAFARSADITEEKAVEHLFQSVCSEFGGLDVVVANAGIGGGGPIEHVELTDFRKLVSVNLVGAFLTLREAARRLSDGGRLVFVSSQLAERPRIGTGAYSATKAGIDAMLVSMSHELGTRGITVNSVRPGATEPGMFAGSDEERKEFFRNLSPFKRLGRPNDIAAVVSFPASDDAAWITGQHIRADGGASN